MEAIGLYEKAFHTKAAAAAIEYSEDGNRIRRTTPSVKRLS